MFIEQVKSNSHSSGLENVALPSLKMTADFKVVWDTFDSIAWHIF